MNAPPSRDKTGLRRIWNALRYSLEGLRAAWQGEAAFRQEVVLAVILLPLAFYLGHTPVERALMAGSLLLVLIVELLNSAIESTVDFVSLENNPLAKRAKDIGSAAVLVSLVNAGIVWGVVLMQRG